MASPMMDQPAPPAPPPMQGAPSGEPSPDSVMAADEQSIKARVDAIGAQAPAPTKAFSVAAIGTMTKELNNLIDKLSNGSVPAIEWVPDTSAKSWPKPLPAAVFVPLFALGQAVQQIKGGEFASTYALDPMTVTDDPGLRMLAATLLKMGKDKKLVEAFSAPAEEVMGEAEAGPVMPSDQDEVDAELANSMK